GEDRVAGDHGGKQVRLDAGRRGVDPAQTVRRREQGRRKMEADEDVGVGQGPGQLVVLGDADELDTGEPLPRGAQLVVADGPAYLLDAKVEDDLHGPVCSFCSSSARRRVRTAARPAQSTPRSASTGGCW